MVFLTGLPSTWTEKTSLLVDFFVFGFLTSLSFTVCGLLGSSPVATGVTAQSSAPASLTNDPWLTRLMPAFVCSIARKPPRPPWPLSGLTVTRRPG